MKRLSFVAALTLSTMLSACGGGGGGHGYVPPSIRPDNPNQPVVSCTGLTCMTNEGLSNIARRNELYSQALGSSGISLFTSNEVASDDINRAFREMKAQLVDNPINENDGDGLRPYLILAGFENLPETEADLIAWIANRKHMIKRHAEKAHEMYGTEKSVYLDNAKFNLVEETANQDTFINFTIDGQNKINGIEVSENDFGAEALSDKLDKTGESTFSGNDKLHIYEFPYGSEGGRLYIEISGYDKNTEPDLALIKEKLQLKLQERAAEDSLAGDDSLSNMKDTISADIAALGDTTSLEHEILDRKIGTVYTSYAKNLKNGTGNLLYSDFGLVKWDEIRAGADPDDIEEIHANKVFAGGYDAMKMDPKNSMEFTGDAVGGVNYKKIVEGDYGVVESNTMQLEGGKATLKFANGTENLNVTFNNWYDVDVTKNLNTNTGSISFSDGEKITDNKFKFTGVASNNIDAIKDNGQQNFDGFNEYKNTDFIKEAWDKNSSYEGYAGAMNIGYYGKDGNPSEATGYVMYHEESLTNGEKTEVDDRRNPGQKIEKDLINVLEMQIGVGMQKK